MDNDELDISWTKEIEQINSIDKNHIRENMTEIDMHCLFVNNEDMIEKLVSETVMLETLENGGMGIKQETILSFVEK